MPRTDRARKTIKASADRLYQSLTTEDELTQWLPPKGMTAKIENFDLDVGGGYRMTLTYDTPPERGGKASSNEDVVDVAFVRLSPGREVEQLATFQSDDPAFAGAMTMIWTLTPVGDATEVDIVCENVPDAIKQEDHAAGLNSSLDNLAEHVERGV